MANIVILGVGGHGIQSLAEFFLGSKYKHHNITLVLDCVDSGGDTGRAFDVIEALNIPGLDTRKILPSGDWRNNQHIILQATDISDPLVTYKKQLAQTLNLRIKSSDVESVKINFHNILRDISYLSADSLNDDFYNLLNTWADDYISKYQNIHPSSEMSVGNLFLNLTQIYCQLNQIDFAEFIKDDLQLLPKNVTLKYLYPERTTLYAKSLSGISVDTEAHIDEYPEELLPSEFKVIKPDGEFLDKEDISETLELIKNADLIIKPNGSLTNVMPAFNVCADTIVKYGKKVLCLINVVKEPNEVGVLTEVSHFSKLGLNAIFVTARPLDQIYSHDGINEVLYNYARENKNIKIPPANFKEIIRNAKNYGDLAERIFQITPLYAVPNGYTPHKPGDEITQILDRGLRNFRGIIAEAVDTAAICDSQNFVTEFQVKSQKIRFTDADMEIMKRYELEDHLNLSPVFEISNELDLPKD